VSYWLIEGQGADRHVRRVAFVDIASPEAVAEPLVLSNQECAAYFEAVASTAVFVTADALNDPRLEAIRDSYLVPNGIRASMCVSITLNADQTSVLTCSHRAHRTWTEQEFALLRSVASQISIRRARRCKRELEARNMAEAIHGPP